MTNVAFTPEEMLAWALGYVERVLADDDRLDEIALRCAWRDLCEQMEHYYQESS